MTDHRTPKWDDRLGRFQSRTEPVPPAPDGPPQPARFAIGDRVTVTRGWNRGVSGTITAVYEYPGGYGYEFDTPRNVHLSAPETNLTLAR